MTDFDLNDFLSKRAEDGLRDFQPTVDPSSSTLDVISSGKRASLEQAIARRQHKLTQTIAAKVGLDAESIPGQVANIVGSTANDIAKLAGNAAALPLDVYADYQINENDDMVAGNQAREQAEAIRQATNLDEFVPMNPDGSAQSSPMRRLTVDGALALAQGSTAAVEGIVGLGSLVSGGRAGQLAEEAGFRPQEGMATLDSMLSPEMRAANKNVEDADGFVDTLAAAGDNLSVVPHNILKSIPSMVAGGVIGKGVTAATKVGGGIAGAIGEGAVMAGTQAEGIRQKTDDGRLTLKQSLLAAGTGVMGTAVGVAGNKLAKALKVADIDEAVVTEALNKSTRSGLTRTALAGAIEGGEELLQSGGEQIAQNVALDKDWSEGVGDAAALGLITGAPMGAAVGAAQGAMEKVKATEAKAQEVTAFQDAVDKVDPSPYLDPKDKTNYAPDKAVAVLFAASQKEDVTQEAKQTNLVQASKIVNDLSEKVEMQRQDVADRSPEGLAKLEATVANLQTQVAAVDPAAPEATELQRQIDVYAGVVEDIKSAPVEELKQMQFALTGLESKLAQAEEIEGQFKTLVQPKPEELNAQVVQASQSPQAAASIVTLAMNNPDALSKTDLNTLIKDTGNVLTESQRGYLRQFDAARVARNKMMDNTKVSQEVLVGTDKAWGIQRYQKAMAQALAQPVAEQAEQVIARLGDFATSHVQKAQVVRQAYNQARDTNTPVQVIYANDQWQIAQTPISQAEMTAGGFPEIRPGKFSRTLVQDIQTEAKAIQATLGEFTAARELKWNTTAPVVSTPAAPVVAEVEPAAEVDVAPGATESTGELATEKNKTEAAPETGKLTQFSAPKVAKVNASNYQQVNILSQFFEQARDVEVSKLSRPLVATKDLMGKVWKKEASLKDFAPDTTLTTQQETVLKLFSKSSQAWNAAMQALLPKANTKGYSFENPIEFFLTPEGDLEENVKSAISVAMFSYLNDKGRDLVGSKAHINGLMGWDGDHAVTGAVYDAVGHLGQRESLAANDIGQTVLQVLGIKALDTAPQNERARLEAGVGQFVIAVMLDQGLIERQVITKGKLDELGAEFGKNSQAITTENVDDKAAKHYFLRVPQEGVPKQIMEASTGSQNVLDKVFATGRRATEPSLTPPEFTQETTQNTDTPTPDNLVENLNQLTKAKWGLHLDRVNFLKALPAELVDQMIGVVPVTDTTVHKANRAGLNAKNDALIRDKQAAFDYIDQMTDKGQDLYVQYSIWKHHRVGMTGNVLNPQASKVARFLMGMREWETTIDFADTTQVDEFMLQIGAGLGVKIDKQNKAKSLADTRDLLATDEMQAAMGALSRVLEGETLQDFEQQAIAEAVGKGGENLHSFASLMEVVKFDVARDAGTEFKTSLMGEVDGVTNGPMLSQILFGVISDFTGNQGGFYPVGAAITDYPTWRGQAGNQDYYESLASRLTQNLIDDFSVNDLAPVFAITGDLTAKVDRNIVKRPLTAVNYGSSMGAALDGMADEFIDGFYGQIEKLAALPTEVESNAGMDALMEQVNTMLKAQGVSTLNVSDPMEAVLPAAQDRALRTYFKETVGEAMTGALKETLGDFIEARDQYNKMGQVAFSLYDTVYQHMRDSFAKQAVKAGDVASLPKKDGGSDAIHELTNEQEALIRKRLKAMEPVLATAISSKTGKREAGVRLASAEKSLSSNKTYSGQLKLARPVPSANGEGTVKTMRFRGMEKKEVGPGVASVVNSVQSTDSGIISSVYKNMAILNVHDAGGAGINKLGEMAVALNKATFDNLLTYSPASAMRDTLESVLTGLAQVMQDNADTDLPAKIKAALAQAEVGSVTQLLESATAFAVKTDTAKLQYLQTLGHVSQYGLAGHSYTVSASDRQAAQDVQAALTQAVKPKLVAKLQDLDNVLDNKVTKPAAAVPAAPKESTWGELGTPLLASDAALVAAFEAKPSMRASELFGLLDERLQASSDSTTDLQRKLLKLLSRAVDKNLKVTYVTAATAADQAAGEHTSRARGWFTTVSGQDEVFIKSPEFVESGVTAELVMHELVHSVVAELVDTAEQGKGDPQVLELVQDLEALLSKAQAHMKGKPALKDKYADAVSSVQELISWGLTNQGFQQEVLQQVSMQSKTGKNALVTGMQKFIDTVVGLIFRNSDKSRQAIAVNGMTVLINNTSGLFAAASKQSERQAGLTLAMNSSVDPLTQVNSLSSIELFERLSAAPAAFGAHLRMVQTSIADKLHGPFGAIKAGLMAQQAVSVTDRFIKALETGVLPFTSSAQASGFLMSQQEGFVLEQIEATVKMGSDNTGSTTLVYRELAKLYEEARNKLKPADFHDGDWSQRTPSEEAQAQAKWDFIFTAVKGADGKSDYLARFAALGLAHEPVAKMLRFSTAMDKRNLDGMTLWEKLQAVFERILNTLHQRMTHTTAGQLADSKLMTLVDQLVGIEAKRRALLANPRNGMHDIVDAQTKKISDGVRASLQTAADSKFFKDSRSNVVKAIGAVGSAVLGDRLELMLEGIQRMRDQQTKQRHGLVLGLFNEIRGSHDGNLTANELLRASNNNERIRKQLITDTGKLLLGGFAKEGSYLKAEAKKAITQVGLRADMQALLDHFTQAELQNLLTDKKALEHAIGKFQAQLKKGPNYLYYRSAADDLAYFMATGENHSQNLVKNVQGIAELFGTHLVGKVSVQDVTAAQAILEPLVSLMALKYTGSTLKDNMAAVMAVETARGTDSGVLLTLRTHRELQQQARDRLFKGNETLMIKGYVPEVFNPHITVVSANAKNGLQLQRMGYSKSDKPLAQDKADPYAEPVHLYWLEDGGLKAYVTGIFSTKGAHAKGSTVHAGHFDMAGQTLHAANQRHSALIARRKAADIRAMFTRPESYTAAKVEGNFLAPVFNSMGGVANYAYLMNHATKDSLLKRDNNFEELLGKFAGSTFDKESSQELNTKAVQALHEQYLAEYAKRPENYLKVGPDSPDASLREAYKLLPEATKQVIQDTWGNPNMLVRSDLIDMNFGYRKFSLTDSFAKSAKGTSLSAADERNLAETMFVDFWSFILGGRSAAVNSAAELNYATPQDRIDGIASARAGAEARAAVRLRRAEDIWQEIVSEIKDILVVKSGLTLLGNIMSNVSELVWIGVPLTDIVKHHRVALRGVLAYRKDAKELYKLQQLLATGTIQGSEASMKQRIIQLEDGLERNPVKGLIDAGLLPTIVEDVAQDTDEFSYKTKLARKTEKFTNKLNKHVRTAGRTLYMTHDTPLYQLMSQGTQLSDFVARYTAYQYMTGRKRAPMTGKQAVQFVSDAFVNYDIPTHRSMQYLNDMGIIWFTKYYLRIQKVIMHLWRDNPARAMMLLGIDQYFAGAQTLMDSGFMNHIGNPLSIGALKYPGSLDEIATLNALMYPLAGE